MSSDLKLTFMFYMNMKFIFWILLQYEVSILFVSDITGLVQSFKSQSCWEFKQRSVTVKDGDYTIYPKIYKDLPILIYCHNMASVPREYVSLHYENGGEFANMSHLNCSGYPTISIRPELAGNARFSKIAVDIRSMIVDTTDFTFAKTEGREIPFGEPGDCLTYHHDRQHDPRCPPVGNFIIDTRDTGVIVDPDIEWVSRGTGPANIVKRSDLNQVLNITCGGYCGDCHPNKPLKLKAIKINGGWSSWWVGTHKSCEGTCEVNGTFTQILIRGCNKPWPQFGGKQCDGSQEKRNVLPCHFRRFYCPINGQWASWVKLTLESCSQTCDLGTGRYLYGRSCTNPPPGTDGKYCVGNNSKYVTQICFIDSCPVEGTWSTWNREKIGACSNFCNRTVLLTRICLRPASSGAGSLVCEGNTTSNITEICLWEKCHPRNPWIDVGFALTAVILMCLAILGLYCVFVRRTTAIVGRHETNWTAVIEKLLSLVRHGFR